MIGAQYWLGCEDFPEGNNWFDWRHKDHEDFPMALRMYCYQGAFDRNSNLPSVLSLCPLQDFMEEARK